jgi:hypothetical protein
VRLGSGAVETHRKPRQARLFEPEDDFARQQRRGAGRERDTDAHLAGVRDEFKKVRPFDRVAARKHEDGHVHSRNLIDQVLTLVGGQLHRVAQRLRGRPAVHAGEVASLSHFPDGQKRPLVEIDGLNLRVHDSMKPAKCAKRSD